MKKKGSAAAEGDGEADAAAAGGGAEGGARARAGATPAAFKPPTSKRSLLRKPNRKNVWPQQPKIQDAERRAQAYLRAAGLLDGATNKVHENNNNNNNNNHSNHLQHAEDGDDSLVLGEREIKFGRQLGGPDQRARHQAVRELRRYLRAKCDIRSSAGQRRVGDDRDDDDDDNSNGDDVSDPPPPGGISELELLKLCKALWHTLYMADKAVVQDELSQMIAKLLWCLVGTPDEDSYAGDCYFVMNEQEEDEDGDDDDEDDSDEDVVMEELVNTLDDHDNDSADEECDDDPSSDGEGSMIGPEQEASAARGTELDEDEGGDDEEEIASDDEDFDDDDTDPRLVPHCRGAHLASLFVRCLLRTIRREWHNMDKYRVDKFYGLLRHLVHQMYQYLSDRDYHPGIVQLFNDAVFEEALRETPNGIRYHLIDVAVDELCAVQHRAKKDVPFTADDFLLVLEPYFALAQHGCGEDTVQGRAVENVLMRFLDRYSVVRAGGSDSKGGSGSTSTHVFRHVHVGTVANFIFEIAGDMHTEKESYRKALHETFKAYVRRIKSGTDVDMSQLQVEVGSSSDEDTEGPNNEVSGDAKVASMSDADQQASPRTAVPPSNAETKSSVEEVGGSKNARMKAHKKKKKAAELPVDVPAPESDPDEDEVFQSMNRSLRDDSPWWSESADIPVQASRNKSPVSKVETMTRKKAKPVRAARTPPNSNGAARVITEEELLITLQAQNAAKQAAKDAEAARHKKEFDAITSHFGKGKSKKRGGRDESNGGTKRVKIGEHFNRARSYSASMQGLRTLDKPARSSLTPERGILLNKDARIIKKADAKPPRRRKAVDYFYK